MPQGTCRWRSRDQPRRAPCQHEACGEVPTSIVECSARRSQGAERSLLPVRLRCAVRTSLKCPSFRGTTCTAASGTAPRNRSMSVIQHWIRAARAPRSRRVHFSHIAAFLRTLCERAVGVGPRRRLTRFFHSPLALGTSGGDPSGSIILGGSNESPQPLLDSEQLAQPLIVRLVDGGFSHQARPLRERQRAVLVPFRGGELETPLTMLLGPGVRRSPLPPAAECGLLVGAD